MGVAKAFRIGANLVLTKPINLEQSKGTLRVARGLLRKGELNPRPTPGPAMPSPSAPPISAVSAPKMTPATSETMAAGVAHAELTPGASPVSVPSSLFEAEQVKPHGHEQEKSKPSDFLIGSFRWSTCDGTHAIPDRIFNGCCRRSSHRARTDDHAARRTASISNKDRRSARDSGGNRT